MNVLVVDDEQIALEGIKRLIDWKSFGIEEAFYTYSVANAKEIIQEEQIDILLCDIEMPKGNGLELIEWVNVNGYSMAKIILTCHSEFTYARKALQMGCIDYLLKPVEPKNLSAVIQKSVKTLVRNRKSEIQIAARKELFWREILEQHIDAEEHLKRKRGNYFLPNDFGAEGNLLLLFCIRFTDSSVESWSKSLIEFVLENITRDILELSGDVTILRHTDFFWVILPNSEDRREEYLKKCNHLVRYVVENHGISINVYMASAVRGERMAAAVDRMYVLNQETVEDGSVYSMTGEELLSDMTRKNDVMLYRSRWKHELINRRYDEFKTDLENVFQQKESEKLLNDKWFYSVDAVLMGIIHEVCSELKLDAAALLNDRGMQEYRNRLSSVNDCLSFYINMAQKLEGMLENRGSDDFMRQINEFIWLHMDQDLTREMLAKQFNLNPDYLNRMVKNQTGLSLKKYVLNEKMRYASSLLTSIDESVWKIGERVGFSDYSYFSTVFKKYTGMTPSEYREKSMKETS